MRPPTDWTQTQPSAGSSGGSTTGTTGGGTSTTGTTSGSTSTTGSTGGSSTGSTSGTGSTTGSTGTSSPSTVTFSGSDSGSETTDATYADVVLTAGFAGIAYARGPALGLGIADYLAPSGNEAAAGDASGEGDTSDASGSDQSQDTSGDNTQSATSNSTDTSSSTSNTNSSSSSSSTSDPASSTSQSSGLTAWLQGLYFASVGSQLYAWAHSTAETTDSPLIAALAEGVVGGLQGQANTANGLQDIVIGLLNLGIQTTPAVQVYQLITGNSLVIHSPDWSRGLYGAESDRGHWWSKFLGGNGLFTALTLGLGEALTAVGTASRVVTLEPAAQQLVLPSNLLVSEAYATPSMTVSASEIAALGHYESTVAAGAQGYNVLIINMRVYSWATNVQWLRSLAPYGVRTVEIVGRVTPTVAAEIAELLQNGWIMSGRFLIFLGTI